jgi:hypothetical protein
MDVSWTMRRLLAAVIGKKAGPPLKALKPMALAHPTLPEATPKELRPGRKPTASLVVLGVEDRCSVENQIFPTSQARVENRIFHEEGAAIKMLFGKLENWAKRCEGIVEIF